MGFHKTLFVWVSVVALFSHNLILTPLAAASDTFLSQKCSGDPHHAPHPPQGHHGGGAGKKPPPSHGGGGCSCSCPPATPPPSPSGCTPSTPTTPSPPSGGYHPPSTPVHIPPPAPIITPVTPVTPVTPITPVTPVTPITPVAPTPPAPFDPGSGPFPCNFWGSHPTLIFGVLGWWATLGGVFGSTSLPGGLGGLDPSTFSLQQALTNNRPDAYGSLLREGTAAFLNSVAAPKGFPFTTAHVKQAFSSALSSDKAAASQARLFRLANEGKLRLS